MPPAQPTPITVINTITLRTPNQQALVADLQVELAQDVKQHAPGFVSQQTLISVDGTQVATIEHWASMQELLAVTRDPRLVAYRERIQQHADLAPVPFHLHHDLHSPTS
jgi:Antibiotic biosynthesis monooxygenase